jgi:soluble lytic murein transglycosylase-like protein
VVSVLTPLALVIGVGLSAVAAAPVVAAASLPDRVCEEAIREVERRRNLPADLLLAIALVESGRSDQASRTQIPWPWTVTAEGRGRFFASLAGAAAAVRRLHEKGVESIDVGCMQINLLYHRDAFASIEDALDPAHNIAYAAEFLSELAAATGSWLAAVGRYHSGSPEQARLYRLKVLKARTSARRGHSAARARAADDAPASVVDRTAAGRSPHLPIVVRGSEAPAEPPRPFAPGRIALPIVLRGASEMER